jgi:hypothetical protein
MISSIHKFVVIQIYMKIHTTSKPTHISSHKNKLHNKLWFLSGLWPQFTTTSCNLWKLFSQGKIILNIESYSKETTANNCLIVEGMRVKVNIIIDLSIWKPLLAMHTINRILFKYEFQFLPEIGSNISLTQALHFFGTIWKLVVEMKDYISFLFKLTLLHR